MKMKELLFVVSADIRAYASETLASAQLIPLRHKLVAMLEKTARLTTVHSFPGSSTVSVLRTWASSGSSRAALVAPVHRPIGEAVDEIHDLIAGTQSTGKRIVLTFLHPDPVTDPGVHAYLLELLEQYGHVDLIVSTTHRRLEYAAQEGGLTVQTISADDLVFTEDDVHALASSVNLPASVAEVVRHCTAGIPTVVMDTITELALRPVAVSGSPEQWRAAAERCADRYLATLTPSGRSSRLGIILEALSIAHLIDSDVAAVLTVNAATTEDLLALEQSGILLAVQSSDDTPLAWTMTAPLRTLSSRYPTAQGTARGERMIALAHHHRRTQTPHLALRYAAEAHEWPLVVDVVEESWVSMLAQHMALLRDILVRIPPEYTQNKVAVQAGLNLFTRNGSRSTSMTDGLPRTVETLRQLAATDEGIDRLRIGSVQSIMHRVSGDFPAAAELAVHLSQLSGYILEINPERITDELPVLRLQWGITHQLAGDLTTSSIELNMAYRGREAADTVFVAANAAGSSAMNWAMVGEPTRAQLWLDYQSKHPIPAGWLEQMVQVSGLVARTLLALDRLEVETAGDALTALGEPSHREELWAYIVYARCLHALATGTAFSALVFLRRQRAAHPHRVRAGSAAMPLLAAMEIDLMLACGEGNNASFLAQTLTAPESHPWTLISVARLHYLTGDYNAALTLCRELDADQQARYPGLHTEALLLEASIHLRMGHPVRAGNCWRWAVTVAEQTGALRPFTTIADADIDELQKIEHSELVSNVRTDIRPVFPPAVPLVVVTEREHAVLALLATGMGTADIAKELFVSINTVKTQLRSLYQKIGAHNRHDVVIMAKHLSII
ncbi:LuxR C-terminal-related transcriptional regulator [Rhodococcus erythropolis]|nr:LuxR C-terminal-related transcriptional regulator [Rhodococcus erythropolis]